MTKLSKQLPEVFSFTRSNWSAWGKWLKELAEYVEFIDRREQGLREEAAYKKKFEATYPFAPVTEKEYEPQTYDEAIALIKGWRRCVASDCFVHWETPTGDWVLIGRDVVVDDQSTYDACIVSWERDKWPELWKEVVETSHRGASMYLYKNGWTFNFFPDRYGDSTPGRVVCQVYLVYKGHADWAVRLRETGGDCD